ncbi:beta-propeller fold lactonase family protein [Halomonas sp. PAMB 3232]|uniref:lactonase family protein n=1 Tax=Halomonas sp. PAMB 3232 TaxID=3075221 RepID=UPI00289D563F|nr:beta-propeller fold lactonase family protein [Halomonas sp. PAMB 3232]WNL39464.1 beta-propeller fold lactonase family protein [Halomonas sp. PAMB 3232]
MGATLLGTGLTAQANTYVYVSNADDGAITSYILDRAAGTLEPLETTTAGEGVMPMAVSPDRHYLYASVRSEPFRVLTYRIDRETGALSQQGSGSLPASMPNIDTDQSGAYLFSASYSDNLVSVSPIDENGVVGDAQQTVETGRNAHAIHASPDNRYAFASNLGDDRLAQFRFDAETGRLESNDPDAAGTPDDTGPRHFVFSPNGRYVYLLGEFSGAVTTYAFDASNGTLTQVSAEPGIVESLNLDQGMAREAIPEGDDTPRIWAADIQVTPDGRYVYTSERTSSVISTFEANPDTGELTYLNHLEVESQPRGFQIDDTGRYMVVTGQRDDRVGLYRIDPENGELTRIDDAPAGKNANWVEIVSFEG